MTSPRCDAIRFLLAGGVNTILTLAVYQIALTWFSERISYSVAWAIGLFYVAIIYPDRVFVGGRRDWSSRLWVVIGYVLTYLVGVFVLTKGVEMGAHPRFAIFISLAVTTVFGFLLTRFVLRRAGTSKFRSDRVTSQKRRTKE